MHPAVIWFQSNLPFIAIIEQLNSLLFATLPDEKEVLCRYYDPRNLETFLEVFSQNPVTQKSISEINEWAIWDHDLKLVKTLTVKEIL